MYHDPLGSSFFTEFIELICVNCWKFLASRGLNTEKVITAIEERFSECDDFKEFKQLYLARLRH